MGIERRRHERIDIAIEVRVSGRDKDGRLIQESTLSGNISLSGCAVLLAHHLDAGSELDLKFLCPVSGKEPRVLAFRGSVVRSAPINEAQYIIGIQFLNGTFPMDALG
jgi:c-di-GMP-binding flagellar brake protein YcgR